MRVLIADDDPTTRVLLRAFLEKWGHEVIECENGDQVLASLFTNRLPQLVLLDWMMPGRDGVSVCKAIREVVNRPYTYIILITGRKDAQDILTGLREGANDYLRKPLNAQEFEARVQVAMRMIELNNLVESQRLKLIASSKLSVLGQLASGVAHEVNNPLAIIKAYAEALRRPGVGGEAELNVIGRSIERIQTTMRALRDLASEDDGAPFIETTFSDVISTVLSLCEERVGSRGIQLRLALAEDMGPLRLQKMRICRAVLALIENAILAVEGVHQPFIQIETHQDERFVYIAISDNGIGVPSEVKQNLAHPFVTTRDIAKSSGLGLSIARGIVTFHGGELFLDEKSPVTRFVFTLPQAKKIAA